MIVRVGLQRCSEDGWCFEGGFATRWPVWNATAAPGVYFPLERRADLYPVEELRCQMRWFLRGRAGDSGLRDIVVVSRPFLSAIPRINGCNRGVEHGLSTRHDQVLLSTLVENGPASCIAHNCPTVSNGHVSGGCWVWNLPCVAKMGIVYKG